MLEKMMHDLVLELMFKRPLTDLIVKAAQARMLLHVRMSETHPNCLHLRLTQVHGNLTTYVDQRIDLGELDSIRS